MMFGYLWKYTLSSSCDDGATTNNAPLEETVGKGSMKVKSPPQTGLPAFWHQQRTQACNTALILQNHTLSF